MEENINIAEILKDKPQGTKLYSPICGECKLSYIESEKLEPQISTESDAFGVFYFWDDGKAYNEGECLLFPSDKMRDWAKFAWKKGDVLVNKDGNVHIIFEKFEDDAYKNFHGKYYLWEEGGSMVSFEEDENYMQTSDFNKANKEDAQEYIQKIEKELGGKLKLETLEIEKTQPEFKDGDVVVTDAVPSMLYSKCIFILKGDLNTGESRANSYVFFNINNNHISYDVLDTIERDRNIHLATDSEKQQLFSALEKEGKDWDSEHKMIVDFKPKFDELKPFDKVVVRCSEADRWSIDFFSYKVHNGYICTGDAWFGYCLPYNEETAKLIGTTKDMEI